MSKSPKPLLSFRVYCSTKSRLFYDVKVYEKLADMRLAASKDGGCALSGYDRCLGACVYWTYKPLQPPRTNRIGVIYLQKNNLGSEIVSHECAHAACGFLDRKGIKKLETGHIGSDHGEELAYAVGHMTSRIYVNLYKSKIIS